mmetsp:Transcript_14171/g.27546  ORF Transcript_14171/g.27546 Transcript_14171/m.27546 type:complete len:1328 (-) Transcript_14171:56-4039(-)
MRSSSRPSRREGYGIGHGRGGNSSAGDATANSSHEVEGGNFDDEIFTSIDDNGEIFNNNNLRNRSGINEPHVFNGARNINSRVNSRISHRNDDFRSNTNNNDDDDDTDVQELLSALSNVPSTTTADPGASGLGAAAEFMSDVLSPETSRRLIEATGRRRGVGSSENGIENASDASKSIGSQEPNSMKFERQTQPRQSHRASQFGQYSETQTRGQNKASTALDSSVESEAISESRKVLESLNNSLPPSSSQMMAGSTASSSITSSRYQKDHQQQGLKSPQVGQLVETPALQSYEVADEKEIDARLGQDPCVLCFEDKVVLRSHRGTCVSVARPKRKGQANLNMSMFDGIEMALKNQISMKNRTSSLDTNLSSLATPQGPDFVAKVDGNPTEAACEFAIIGAALRTHTGIVKHGDVVALLSKARGRFLGVVNRDQEDVEDLDSDDEDGDVLNAYSGKPSEEEILSMPTHEPQWHVLPRRKVAGRREHWIVVEIENETTDRISERNQRIAASAARMGRRAKELGYNLAKTQFSTPHKREVTVALRSSDAVLLRSVHAEGLFLGVSNGNLRLFRAPPENGACTWSLVKTPAPYVPLWSRQRPLLNYAGASANEENRDVVGNSALNSDDGLDIITATEDDLVDAVLFAMQGVESDYVIKSSNPDGTTSWKVIEKHVQDAALLQLTSRIMPLCSDYESAIEFVQRRTRPEFGRVSHAMSAAMRALLREYDVLVAQLEHEKNGQRLSLQKLWFYVQPSMRVLHVLASVARRSEASTGGVLLNLVHDLASRGGDAKARSVYHYLVQHATVPYLEMLELWIYHGVIRDPYNEFMVYVDEDATKRTLRDDFNARYWDSRYTLRENSRGVSWHTQVHGSSDSQLAGAVTTHNHVPFFLNRLAEKILTTGKYLNVVRECGRWVENTCAERIPYSDESHMYDQIVTRAHDFASRTLLNLLLEEEQLLPRLRSLKHYFLLDQGDFFVHFMDLAHEELQKPVEQIAVPRLQSLLDVCLRVRNVNDPYQEDLACELVPYALIEHVEAIHDFAIAGSSSVSHMARPSTKHSPGLHGIDAFTLDFKVRWPLSLVLSRQALTKYQLIFRHLFFCKHVERQLCTTWLAHQTTKELNLRSALGPDYCLRQRMLHFLQNFEYYVMFEVLEPRWHELEKRLEHVKTVDELMKHHSEFLDTCLRECLLTHQGLLKTLAKLMTTCLLFAEQIGRFANQLQVDEESMTAALSEHEKSQAGAPPRRPSPESAAAEASAKKRALRKTRIKVQEEHIRRIVTQDSYRQMILRSQETFDGMLNQFMDELLKEATQGEYHSHLTNLCTRLDFNSYYQK